MTTLIAPASSSSLCQSGRSFDDGVVERHADAAAHADDHRLAVERRRPRSSKCSTRSSATRARRFSAPTSASTLAHLRLSRSCSLCGLVLGQVGDLGVDLRLLVLVEFDARQPALVVDRHRRAVLDRAADVVDVDVVAEHGGRVHVVLLDRRAGEADEGGVRQGVAQVLGEAVGDLAGLALDLGLEAVLAAVRLVGDHDRRCGGRSAPDSRSRPSSGENFCKVVKITPPDGRSSSLRRSLAVLGLLRRLPQQVLAHAEGAEELVVEVVAVGQHDERRVLHRRVLDDLARIERHQQALARALRVPDHADLAVAVRARSPRACCSTACRTAWNW